MSGIMVLGVMVRRDGLDRLSSHCVRCHGSCSRVSHRPSKWSASWDSRLVEASFRHRRVEGQGLSSGVCLVVDLVCFFLCCLQP